MKKPIVTYHDHHLELNRIKAFCNGAAPGPWKGEWSENLQTHTINDADGHLVAYLPKNSEYSNSRFVWAARADVEYLIKRVEELDAKLFEAKMQLDAYKDSI